MILLLCPANISEAEFARLKAYYLPHNIFVERNTKHEWDMVIKSEVQAPIIYPSYPCPCPYYPTITYTMSTSTTSGYSSDGSTYIHKPEVKPI